MAKRKRKVTGKNRPGKQPPARGGSKLKKPQKRAGKIYEAPVEVTLGGKRERAYLERPLPGDFQSWPSGRAAHILDLLFERTRKLYPDAALWSGGVSFKTSASSDKRNRPIWDDKVITRQLPFRPTIEWAKKEALSQIKDLVRGERRGKGVDHYYRMWIRSVIVFALSPKGQVFNPLARMGSDFDKPVTKRRIWWTKKMKKAKGAKRGGKKRKSKKGYKP